MDKVEFLILRNLLHNEEYVRKVIPFIKADYFEDYNQKVVFEEIIKFVEEYNQPATKEVLCIETEKRQDINDSSFKEITQLIGSLEEEHTEFNWLVDTTEKWCRDRAIYLALMESIQLADGKTDETKGRDAIPTILSDALAVSFDTHIGHDYLLDYEERYELYHKKENKIEFDLEYFNKITKGGLPNKTLNIALAGTGVGKSLFMCHVASSALLQGKIQQQRIVDILKHYLMNLHLRSLSDLTLSLLITSIYVLLVDIVTIAPLIRIRTLRLLQRNCVVWLWRQMYRLYLLLKLLVPGLVVVMWISPTPLNLLVFLPLLILCSLLYQPKTLKD